MWAARVLERRELSDGFVSEKLSFEQEKCWPIGCRAYASNETKVSDGDRERGWRTWKTL